MLSSISAVEGTMMLSAFTLKKNTASPENTVIQTAIFLHLFPLERIMAIVFFSHKLLLS